MHIRILMNRTIKLQGKLWTAAHSQYKGFDIQFNQKNHKKALLTTTYVPEFVTMTVTRPQLSALHRWKQHKGGRSPIINDYMIINYRKTA